jgi:hypothetical protein
MAVVSYISSKTQIPGGNAISAISGVGEKALQNTVTTSASDSNGSTYLLFQDVPFNAKLKELWIENAALTGGTSYSIGLYDPKTGAAVSANCLANALDLSVAHKKGFDGVAGNQALDGLAALTHEATQQCLYEIAGDSFAVGSKRGRYDIVITANVAGTSGGKITGRATLTPAG